MPTPILPSASTAASQSALALAAQLTAAQAQFIQATTVLINNAISLGYTQVQPYLPALITSDFVTSYFQPLGYSISYPVAQPGPFDLFAVTGLPEVIPPGYTYPSALIDSTGLPRILIQW